MNDQNLVSLKTRTTEEKREIGIKGGRASGKIRRSKRLLSQIYADVIADLENLPKGQNLDSIVQEIVKKKQPHSVSMLKEIREATEGTKLTVPEGIKIVFEDKTK